MELHKTYADHFAHFLVKHAKDIREFVHENSEDYYDDYELMVVLFNLLIEEHLESDTSKFYGIAMSDVATNETSFKHAVELYKERITKEYVAVIDVSMIEEVVFHAKNDEEAEEMAYNMESDMIKQLKDSGCYNGVSSIEVFEKW